MVIQRAMGFFPKKILEANSFLEKLCLFKSLKMACLLKKKNNEKKP